MGRVGMLRGLVVLIWVCVAFVILTPCGEVVSSSHKVQLQPQPDVTSQLLKDLKTYCYTCHNGERGETFDKFSRQPAFFAADNEQALIGNIREIATRALRYLRSKRMPKATDPLLPMVKRRQMVEGLKMLAMTLPAGGVPVVDPERLALIREAYEREIHPIIARKCNMCHGQGANQLQEVLFGGTMRLARREWDSSAGYPFGGDYVIDPVLQLSRLEVAVGNRTMPPLSYTSTFPSLKLSDREVERIMAWIGQARSLYAAE